jgi:uncharacterized damage-inducible protein DinB
MAESKRIADQLRRAFEGPAWHGPSLKALLADVTAIKAAERPIPHAHSIWEVVLHVSAWETIALRRLQGGALEDPPAEVDWPPVDEVSEKSWQRTLDGLERSNVALREAIELIDDARLNDIVPVKNYSVYYMLHGVIQHDLYHGGQIAILRKA